MAEKRKRISLPPLPTMTVENLQDLQNWLDALVKMHQVTANDLWRENRKGPNQFTENAATFYDHCASAARNMRRFIGYEIMRRLKGNVCRTSDSE